MDVVRDVNPGILFREQYAWTDGAVIFYKIVVPVEISGSPEGLKSENPKHAERGQEQTTSLKDGLDYSAFRLFSEKLEGCYAWHNCDEQVYYIRRFFGDFFRCEVGLPKLPSHTNKLNLKKSEFPL